jgi:predicted O-linked N-acetylglucosamine transferase (SPINDLY family)
MEDEDIGIHLPAGKAPSIDGITWRATDGVEEFKYEKYRNFKDLQLQDAVSNGIVGKKFNDYLNRKCLLYISTSVNLDIQNNQEQSQQKLNMPTYQSDSSVVRLDLGCGINKSNHFIGVDICPGPGVDIVADLSKKFPFDDNSVDEIKAHDVIEHLPDRIHTMNEIWRVCKPGAKIHIFVPSTDGRGAFQDPTHVSFWNINSFFYYCSEFPAYLELCKRYGFKGEFKVVKLEHEESPGGVIHVIAELSVVKPVSTLSKQQIPENTQAVQQYQKFIQENDYLKFLFSSQPYFQEVDETDNYYQYLQNSLDYLHTSIFSNSDSDLWNQVVNNFIQSANFIPAYFNEANLKDIYVKRAEILELFLKNNGCEIDYEFPARPVNRKKSRLGILATHFTPGSETFAYLPVYEYLSRDFEVILYSLQETNHPLEEYCRSCANSFKLLPQNLSEQVNVIRADDLDILFIATNVTAVTNQICLLATHRLARIQATSGGSVVTTGMRHMDYYISGTLSDPSPTAQEHYREKLVKLEGTAHCFSYGCEEEKATAEVDRESLGISEEAVIFVSGANFFKIVPELIHTWAKIIAQVPNSVLVLLPFGPNWSNAYPKQAFEDNLNQVFSQYGISAERLIILDPQPIPNRGDVKEYFKIADLYLDSYPFSGTTSLIEPLQVNLPVISRQGDTFRSAMGAAMMRSLDLFDLVADSEESYIQLAVKLGTNPDLRKQKSDRIKQKMQQNPSFLDSRSYSAQMGTLFQQLFQQYRAKNLIDRLGLRDINLVMFPDWHQSEESLYENFANVLKTMSSNTDKSRITLLIDTDGIDGEDANWLFSSVAMNLLMEEAVDIADELEVSLLDDLTENEWQLLLSLLQGRIVLDNENQNAIAKAKAQSLKVYS